jgi:hypothetical protein
MFPAAPSPIEPLAMTSFSWLCVGSSPDLLIRRKTLRSSWGESNIRMAVYSKQAMAPSVDYFEIFIGSLEPVQKPRKEPEKEYA